MKSRFLKKRTIFIVTCIVAISLLIGCSPNTQQINSNNNPGLQDEQKNTKKDSSNEGNTTDKVEENNTFTKVKSKVQLHEGTYFDDRRFGDREIPLETSCEIAISNLTDTSFDFTVYEVDEKTQEKKVIFLTNTAFFTGDGEEATFSGKEYTLHFTFPDNHSAYPVVTDMEVTGFEPLEGNTYVNNGIPGHEFGQVKSKYSLPTFYG